jgi:hypothetical protein
VTFWQTIAPETRERLWTQLREGLAESGHELYAEAEVRQKLMAAGVPAGCVVGPCLRAVGTVLGVKYVLVGRVDGVESSFDITVTVLETDKGVPVAQATKRCEVCSMMDVEASVRRGSIELGAALRAYASPPPLPPPRARPVPKPKPNVWRWRGWKWVALGVGVAAVGAGTYLANADPSCVNEDCSTRHTAGMASVGTGVVLIGGAGYLFLFDL